MKSKWQDEFAVGRVFELKSRSKTMLPPCVLVTGVDSTSWNATDVATLDATGRTAAHFLDCYYRPRVNYRAIPAFMKREHFTSRYIAKRRRDLERFDRYDMAAINYGFQLTVGGRIDSYYSGPCSLPLLVPGMTWTVFWTRNHETWDYAFRDALEPLLNGAWWFRKRTMPVDRRPWARAWVSAHEDRRKLRAIERFLRRVYPDLERQSASVAHWHDWQTLWTHTWMVGNPGPIFDGWTWSELKTPNGGIGYSGRH